MTENKKEGSMPSPVRTMADMSKKIGSGLLGKRKTQSEMVEEAFQAASERTGLFTSKYAK